MYSETYQWGWCVHCRIQGTARPCWGCNTQTHLGPWPALWWCEALLNHHSTSPQRFLCYSPSGHRRHKHSLTELCLQSWSPVLVLMVGTWTSQSPVSHHFCSLSRCTRWSHESLQSVPGVHSGLSQPVEQLQRVLQDNNRKRREQKEKRKRMKVGERKRENMDYKTAI